MIFRTDRTGNRQRRLRRRIAPLLLGAATVTAFATAAPAETLMDAVEAAYGNNPTLVEQRYLLKSTTETYAQRRGLYGPTIALEGTAQYEYEELGSRSADSRPGQLEVTVRQPVYTGGQYRGQLAQARANVRSGEETLRRVEGETVRNVISAYTAVLRDEQRLFVSRENVQALLDQVAERRARRNVRDATITDVAQSDARLASGEISLAAAEAQLEVSRGEYLRIVGHEPKDLQPLPDLDGLPQSIDEALAAADDGNANLGAARFAEQASRANIATQHGAELPTATIGASAGKSGQWSPFDRHKLKTGVTATLTITQPIFQAGIIRSRIRQAQDQNYASQAVVDLQRRQALQDVVLAWNQLSSARVAVVSGRRQVEAAQIAFAGMQHEEQNGLRTTTDVLNAVQELASAQLNLLSSRATEYTARAALLLAMGQLDARTVNSAIPARDPEADFKKVRWKGISPTEPAAMLLDRIGSASPTAKTKLDLTGSRQPKPAGSAPLPPTPSRTSTAEPLTPISKSPLVPADKIPAMVGDYGNPPPRNEAPR